MKVIIFEDPSVWELYPVTLGRAAFAITCATMRMIDVVSQIPCTAFGFLCRPYLEGISRKEYPESNYHFGLSSVCEELQRTVHDSPDENVLFLNARLVPDITLLPFFRECIAKNERVSFIHQNENHSPAVACAVVPAARLLKILQQLPHFSVTDVLPIDTNRLTEGLRVEKHHPLQLFEYPHHLVKNNMELFLKNIRHRLESPVPALTGHPEKRWSSGRWTELREGVFVGENVKLGEYLVTDTSKGPILVDEGASIGPFCYLKGPVYIGPYSKVIEHSALKEFVGLTHTTKVGGEVEATTIEPYSNKQHHGFLGHSYLGSWINLGAGTCNSDLKNTYGSVAMQYHGTRVATDMQFHGCIIGDYSKTAINTSIFTGKIIGSCSMVYGFVTRNVPSFVNYARSFGQCTELPVDVMINTQQRMFKRRNVEQDQVHVELLQQMFSLSNWERQMETEPLSL
ncbi:MAG: glucose-1-phosphate thymidylyltransferase [Planctomycetaceae bacterium]|nr:glucose-1-phosphate thymidylyltransferase [Planctomycetaceae bacterium]